MPYTMVSTNKPKRVRNFWIELEIDGRKNKVCVGPIGKDGGFTAKIYVREMGKISKDGLVIKGVCDGYTLRISSKLQWEEERLLLVSTR
jgi:hypothetical protein